MKKTLNAKRYDTEKCEILGEIDHYHNNLYSGITYLLRASDGTMLVHGESNGQDCYFRNHVGLFSCFDFSIDNFSVDEEQEKRLAELGYINIVE